MEGGDPERGGDLLLVYGCDGCHLIPGVEGAGGLAGPPLERWAERSYIAGALPNRPPELVAWITDPQAVEPGTAMPDLGVPPEDALHMAAYLFSLGDPRAIGFRSTEPRTLLRWMGRRAPAEGGEPVP